MKIRNASRLGKQGDLGRSSSSTPMILLDSGHDFENLHRMGLYSGGSVATSVLVGNRVIYVLLRRSNSQDLQLNLDGACMSHSCCPTYSFLSKHQHLSPQASSLPFLSYERHRRLLSPLEYFCFQCDILPSANTRWPTVGLNIALRIARDSGA